MVNENALTVIGKANFHGDSRLFGMKLDDRRRHMHAMGKTGMGKTSFLLNMAVSDINNGHGFAFIDPHGDVTDDLLNYIPEHRIKDVVYFSPADMEYPLAFNVLGDVPKNQRHIVGDGLVGVFQKIWADSWGPRLEYILRNAINTLLQYPDTTLLDIMKILVDKEYRKEVVDYIDDPVLKSFWINEFNKYNDKMVTEAISPIQNKVGQFTSSPLIRNIIGQKKSSFDIRKIMDERKILLMNLSKGAVGEGGAQLLGAMMITKMQLAAMSRVDIPQDDRKDFFAYVDEFQNFSTDSFAEILSEARKYRLGLILAHQYIEQLSDSVRAAVFGNVGTTALFRIGAGDAEHMEKEFGPELTAEDLVNLPKYHVYIKLMIDGVTSKPFMANTLPNPPYPPINYRDQIIAHSRETYGRHIDEVSAFINESSAVPEITVPGGKKDKKPSKTVVWKNPALEGGSDKKDEKTVEKNESSSQSDKQEVKSDVRQKSVDSPTQNSPQPQAESKPQSQQRSSVEPAKRELSQPDAKLPEPPQSSKPVASPTPTKPAEEFRLDISDTSNNQPAKGFSTSKSFSQDDRVDSSEDLRVAKQDSQMSVEKSAETYQEEKISVFSEITSALQEELEQMPDWKPAPEGEVPNGTVMQPRKEEKKKWEKKKNKKKFDKKSTKPSSQQLPPELPPLGAPQGGESSNLMAEKLKQMFAAKETEDGQKVYEVKDDFKRQQEEKERLKEQEREAKRRQKELEREQSEKKQTAPETHSSPQEQSQEQQKSEKSIEASSFSENKEESPQNQDTQAQKPKLPTLDKPADERFDLSSFKKPSGATNQSEKHEVTPLSNNEEKSQSSQKKDGAEASSLPNKKEHTPKGSETPSVPKMEVQESKQESEPERRVESKPQETKHQVKPGETVSFQSEQQNNHQSSQSSPSEDSQKRSDDLLAGIAESQQISSTQEQETTEPLSSLVSDLLSGIQDGHSGKTKQEILHQAFHETQPTEKRILKPGQVIQFKKK
jgi:plastocyanin